MDNLRFVHNIHRACAQTVEKKQAEELEMPHALSNFRLYPAAYAVEWDDFRSEKSALHGKLGKQGAASPLRISKDCLNASEMNIRNPAAAMTTG